MKLIKRIAVGLFLVLVSVLEVGAETVTHKEAKTWAQTFFNAARGEVTAPVKMVYNGKDLTTRRLFTPFFIYNSPRGGFVIISGENKMFPILGYSLTESFDPSKLDPSARALLKEYARQIELIRYDSTVPVEAIQAWQNKNGYINYILTSESVSGFSLPDEEGKTQEFALMMSDLPGDDSMRSELYTPEQWKTLVADQLRNHGSAIMGVVDGKTIEPLVAVGSVGDYVKFSFDTISTPWNLLMFPSEVYAAGLVGRLGGEPIIPEDYEEAPFAFHDEVMEMYPAETRASQAMIYELDRPSRPVLRALGAGHFEIDYPSEVELIRVFNVSGQSVLAQTYGGRTRTAVINIEDQPSGFYVIAAQTAGAVAEPLKVAR